MTEFLNVVVSGASTGAVYVLLALGFSLVFNVSGVFNLAQGAFVIVGALTVYSLHHSAHLSLGLALTLGALAIAAVATILEWTVVRPAMTKVTHGSLLMITAGFLIAFEGLAYLIWGDQPYHAQPFSGSRPVVVHGVYLPTQTFWVVGLMVALMFLLRWLLFGTKFGRALRASSENTMAARLMGIPVDGLVLFSFTVSGVLGMLAGAFILPLTALDFTSMLNYTNQGIIAATLGGIGSVAGALVGGLGLGIIQALVSTYISSVLSNAVSLFLLIAMLVLRPKGLLGFANRRRIDADERRAQPTFVTYRTSLKAGRGLAVVAALLITGLPAILGSRIETANLIGIYCLAIVGLDLLTGYGGVISLGQAGFMAIGGYTTALLVVDRHWPTLAALGAGMILAVIVAAVLATTCRRLEGMYLATATLAFGLLIDAVATGVGFTGGANGVVGVRSFSLGGFSFGTNMRFYYLIWILVGLATLLLARIGRRDGGRMLLAVQGDRLAAEALGLSSYGAILRAFTISAALGAAAGGLYATNARFISDDMVNSSISLTLITMLVIGGMTTWIGPMIGVTLFIVFPHVSSTFSRWELVVEGVFLVVMLRYARGGLYGLAQRGGSALLRRRREVAVESPDPAEVRAGAELVERGGL